MVGNGTKKRAEIYFEFMTFGIDLLAKGISKISDLGSIIHSTVKIKNIRHKNQIRKFQIVKILANGVTL